MVLPALHIIQGLCSKCEVLGGATVDANEGQKLRELTGPVPPEPQPMLKRAIVRPPAANFAEGLTSVDLGKPVFAKALEQHARYCDALEQCGLTLTRLPSNGGYPDSTFVEDTAILTSRCAIVTRPGAASRMGEV